MTVYYVLCVIFNVYFCSFLISGQTTFPDNSYEGPKYGISSVQ